MADNLDPAMMDFIIATNNFGSGPGYMDAKSNPYNRVGQRLNFLQDVQRYGGFYLDDLLGLGPEPEAPSGAAPQMPQMGDVFQSDLRGAYAGNPLISEAFAQIQQGADPTTVLNGLLADPTMGGTLQDANAYLPMSDNGFGQQEPNGGALAGILNQFATEVQREGREGAQAGSKYQLALQDYERQMLERQQQQAEYDAYNNPMSQWQLEGKQSFGDEKADLLSQLNPANFQGSRTVEAPRQTQSVQDRLMSKMPGWVQKSNGYQKPQAGPGAPQSQPQLSYGSNQLLSRMAGENMRKKQADVRPSGRELDNRKRLSAAYQMLFGENL